MPTIALRQIEILEDGTARVPLTRGLVAIIDADLAPAVGVRNWYAFKGKSTWYGKADVWVPETYSKHFLLLHRVVMDATSDKHVDHIDGNGLDNRRSNLRLCTNSQNSANRKVRTGSSRFRGVTFDSRRNRWCAQITHDYIHRHLGSYRSEIEAALAYNKAASSLFGEFAVLNQAQ